LILLSLADSLVSGDAPLQAALKLGILSPSMAAGYILAQTLIPRILRRMTKTRHGGLP
jgi:hypothetical protein